MAAPSQGVIKIFPATTTIISGDFALNSDATPQPDRSVETIDAYYQTRTDNRAIAPCLRRDTEKPAASGFYVPSGGDYELQFSPSTIGIEFYDNYPGTPVDTIDFISADFPMGMTISSLMVYFDGEVYFGPGREREVDGLIYRYFGANAGVSIFPPNTLVNYDPGFGDQLITFPARWTFIQIMKQFGFKVPVNANAALLGAQIPRAVCSECFLIGTYNTLHIETTSLTENAVPGSIVELSSAGNDFNVLDPDTFAISWGQGVGSADDPFLTNTVTVPRRNVLAFTPSYIKLLIPKGVPYAGLPLILTVEGTIFTGVLTLAIYNTTIVDGSGLYTLSNNKRNDTYYDRGVSPVDTIDYKIPDPFIQTGLFNGE